jgi:hypothetical protein
MMFNYDERHAIEHLPTFNFSRQACQTKLVRLALMTSKLAISLEWILVQIQSLNNRNQRLINSKMQLYTCKR